MCVCVDACRCSAAAAARGVNTEVKRQTSTRFIIKTRPRVLFAYRTGVRGGVRVPFRFRNEHSLLRSTHTHPFSSQPSSVFVVVSSLLFRHVVVVIAARHYFAQTGERRKIPRRRNYFCILDACTSLISIIDYCGVCRD